MTTPNKETPAWVKHFTSFGGALEQPNKPYRPDLMRWKKALEALGKDFLKGPNPVCNGVVQAWEEMVESSVKKLWRENSTLALGYQVGAPATRSWLKRTLETQAFQEIAKSGRSLEESEIKVTACSQELKDWFEKEMSEQGLSPGLQSTLLTYEGNEFECQYTRTIALLYLKSLDTESKK